MRSLICSCLLSTTLVLPASADPPAETPYGSWTSGDVHLVIPETGKSLHAFSVTTGRWSHLHLEAKLPEDAARFSFRGMTIVQTNDTIYAHGARTDAWKVLTLHNPGSDAEIVDGVIRVRDGSLYYMIGSDSRYWEGVDIQTGAVSLPHLTDNLGVAPE